MKKLILCLMVGFLFASFAIAVEKEKKNESQLILDIDAEGKVYIGGNNVIDEKLSKLLDQIGDIDSSFIVIVRGNRKTSHHHIKRVLDMVTDSSLYRIKFQATKEVNSEPSRPVSKASDEPFNTESILEIDIRREDYLLGNKKKSLNEVKGFFSKFTDKERKEKIIAIAVGPESKHEMLIKLLDLCSEEELTRLNVMSFEDVNESIPKDLAKTLRDFIKLLDNKKYVEAIKKYMNPTENEKVLKGRTVEEMVEKDFKNDNADRLLGLLRKALFTEPMISNDGSVVKFQLKEKRKTTIKEVTLTFILIENQWYLNNGER